MFLPFSVEMDIGLVVGCRLNIKELQRQDFIDPRATLIKQRQKKPIPYGIAVAFCTFQYQADIVYGLFRSDLSHAINPTMFFWLKSEACIVSTVTSFSASR